MCGRYTLTKPLKFIEAHFAPCLVRMEYHERYNVAPTQKMPVALLTPTGREILEMRWGLIPSWAKDDRKGSPLINARAESVHEKPSFKNAFRRKRCLVPADGFFEWKREGTERTPYYIFQKSGGLFVFAGLWEEWKGPEGPVRTFCIITTGALPELRNLHDRIPVILRPELYGLWLNPETGTQALRQLLVPSAAEPLEMRAVSKRVNSPKNEGPDLLLP